MFLSSFFISLLATAYLIPKILFISIRKHLIDQPNARKVHTCVSSRLGGVAFFPAIFFAIGVTVSVFSRFDTNVMEHFMTAGFIMVMCACILLYLIGIADDVVGVSWRVKFVFQIIAAGLIILSGTWVNNLYGICGVWEISAWVGVPLTIFLIVFVINAVNLIDGIDGLASGLSCVALLFLGVLFLYEGKETSSLLAFTTLGALIPFFYYNVFGIAKKRYKIFMGDTGSLVIGLILSILAVKFACLVRQESSGATYPFIVVAFSVLLVPGFDVIRVVLHRYRAGKPLFLPDKNHIHHKFLALGWSHRKAMCTILVLASLFIMLNMALCLYININVLIVLDIVLWTVLHVWLSSKIKKRWDEAARLEQKLIEAGCRNCKERDALKVKFFLEKKTGKVITIDDIKEKSGAERLRVDSILFDFVEEGIIVLEKDGETEYGIYDGKTTIQWFDTRLPLFVESYLTRIMKN
ncbi:MraY family glycosyltransferase [Butyricimonas sp.]|uniref:MraY family glycosyltransferase n=1 Tax=Butyricimonas sp. TaxID=1969738 RepID=UPI0034553A5D